MGTGKIILIIALVVVAVASLAAAVIIWRLSAKDGGSDGADGSGGEKIGEITSVESFLLHLSGMRITSEYEIAVDGDKATISLYFFNYASGEEKRVLEKSAEVDAAELFAKLNECTVARWDGFVGEHPRGVLDGTMFTLEATVNGGKRIYAHGSQNFPKHYHDLVGWLDENLRG